MNKAVFLDRDGTINVDQEYIYKPEDFAFLPGAVEGLRILQECGFRLIIITNQSGIARGIYSEEDYLFLNEWMLRLLKQRGILIDRVYYCPHLPDAKIEKYRKRCNCRKPRTGLYLQAAVDYNIDFSQSFAIGDRLRDCAICENTGCHGYLIGDKENPETIDEVKSRLYSHIFYADDLLCSAIAIKEITETAHLNCKNIPTVCL